MLSGLRPDNNTADNKGRMPRNAFGEDSQKTLKAYTLPFMLRLLGTKASAMPPLVPISSGIFTNSEQIFLRGKHDPLYPTLTSCV
jgi:hypothetical protein